MKDNFLKEYWSKSQLSFLKIAVTAVAAITMTYISSKLSVISGAYIAGIIAVISLLLNEIYNFFFQWITDKASKTITKLEKSTTQNTEETVNNNQQNNEKEVTPSSSNKDDYPLPPPSPSRSEKRKIREMEGKNISFIRKIGDFLNTHPNIRLVIFFFLVSGMVIGINQLSPKINQVVNPSITIGIDEETKQEIIDEAVDKSPSKTVIQKEENNNHELKGDIENTKKELDLNKEAIEEKYSLLVEENEKLLETQSTLAEKLATQEQDNRKLQEEIDKLSEKLADIEKLIEEILEERTLTPSENVQGI